MGTALGQVGKPYALGTDGPGTFSCTGLVRFALRSIGINDAPWDHMAYLGAYPTVTSPEPGDVVVYPDGAAMYIGNGEVVMASHADGAVGTYPMNSIGTPVGFARPTGSGGTDPETRPTGSGGTDPAVVDPAPVDPAPVESAPAEPVAPFDQTAAPVDQTVVDPAGIEPTVVDPTAAEPALVDPALSNTTVPTDQMVAEPVVPVDQTAVGPTLPM